MTKEQEILNLKAEVENLKKQHSEYLTFVQTKVISKIDVYRNIAKVADKELDRLEETNENLINFILNNGLGTAYLRKFGPNNLHPNFADKQDINYILLQGFQGDKTLENLRTVNRNKFILN
ncbi:hypothetical protein ACNKXS_03600 [Christiangramia marina]|uniref:hypothetical protein n=1 Tax=Christiangramia marina TaxID=409436 RepID=UPI003AA80E6F